MTQMVEIHILLQACLHDQHCCFFSLTLLGNFNVVRYTQRTMLLYNSFKIYTAMHIHSIQPCVQRNKLQSALRTLLKTLKRTATTLDVSDGISQNIFHSALSAGPAQELDPYPTYGCGKPLLCTE